MPTATVPLRDLVIEHPSRAAARTSASASVARYPVNDGAGRSVDISVSPACSIACTDADPQAIADFLGTLLHGDEMNPLTVLLVTSSPPAPFPARCSSSADRRLHKPVTSRARTGW